MIKSERERKILAMLKKRSIVSVKQLYEALSGVSNVTVRRDIVRLAKEGKLLRVHGGVKRMESGQPEVGTALKPSNIDRELATSIAAELNLPEDDDIQNLQQIDVIVLPPIEGRLAQTIRYRAQRTGVFCLDESSPDGSGTYLGVDNNRAGFDVGSLAGQEFAHKGEQLHCLVIEHDSLSNTRDRAFGFLKGLREAFPGEVHSVSVDAGGVYMEAYRQTRGALEAFPQIELIFAINDHSILAAIDAARSLQRTDIAAYCVGGEGNPIFEELEKNQMLRGFAAMFPQVVARSAVNAINRFFAAEHATDPVITPHRIITGENIADYYYKPQGEWELQPAVIEELAPLLSTDENNATNHSVLFIQHYPAHSWYRTLSDELRGCCEQVGHEYHTASVKSQVLDELRHNRREIAARASKLIKPGDAIIINGGEASRHLAMALREHKQLTVVTNSLAVMEILADYPDVTVMLTGGKYRRRSRDLVGTSIGTILQNIRIDSAFLSVDGLSMDFGASCADERDAESVGIFSQFSRKTIVLADHSIMREDANFRALPLRQIDDIVTDFGVPAKQLIDYSAQGVGMIIAGDVYRPDDKPRDLINK